MATPNFLSLSCPGVFCQPSLLPTTSPTMATIVCQPVVLPKRTNSLGFAASDCFACRAAERPCDRRRPRCLACTSEGAVCPGFAQKLNWQPGIASRGKMSHRTFTVPEDEAAETTETATAARRPVAQPSQFSFVPEGGGGTRSKLTKRTAKLTKSKSKPKPSSAGRPRRNSSHSSNSSPSSVTAVVQLHWPVYLPLHPQIKLSGDMLNYYKAQFASSHPSC